MIYRIVGAVLAFMALAFLFWCFGFNFDQRGINLGFWFLLSLPITAVGWILGSLIEMETR